MIKNITDVMSNLNSNELDLFFSKTDASITSNSQIKETKIDYGWLTILEDTIYNLDKIVRTPRRFIVQEEEVVIVEKIKNVTQLAVKHLSQHSENIQDIEEDGFVRPSKLLNVHKEDTNDIYENRFIYTLVKRLEDFMKRQLQVIELVSSREIDRQVHYKANTQIENRHIEIELNMKEHNEYELVEKEMNYKDRILACYEMVCSFRNSEMIKALIGCTPVRNPIRKTNLLRREPNFQKAVILWNALDDFEFRDPKVVNYENKVDSSKETKDEFTLGYYINSNAIDDTKERMMQYRDVESKLNKLINEYIYESDHNVDVFNEKVKEFYKKALEDKDKRIKNITNIYNKFINNHDNTLEKLNNLYN